MTKISLIPSDASPTTSDYLLGNKSSGPATQTFPISVLIALFWTLANIPAGSTSPITRDGESQFAFVASGMVWSGDAYASTRNASMTAGVCYINGRRISIAAVTARTFTASVDTYIDVLDNLDGTGTLVYTTALNNAASPALAANSIRIGIIVTGATSIAASTSVNQGQESIVLPIASSIPYQVTDSLGNLICCRDPQSRVLGYRQLTGTVTGTTIAQVTGLTVPFIVPANRKVEIAFVGSPTNTGTATNTATLWDGVVNSGTQLSALAAFVATATGAANLTHSRIVTLSSGLHTVNAGLAAGSGTWSTSPASTTSPMSVTVELA